MKTPLNTFHGMKHRCYDPKSPGYKYYGAKGIGICDKWLKNPVSFVTWSEQNGWAPGKHIHRIDSHMGYSPENCEWLIPGDHSDLHHVRSDDNHIALKAPKMPKIKISKAKRASNARETRELRVRPVSTSLHRALRRIAFDREISLNTLLIEALAEHLERMKKGGPK